MITLDLQATPNQKVTARLGGYLYELTIKECLGGMVATIVRDGVEILTNARAVAGTPLIPYAYLIAGNFLFITTDYEIPYYTNFGTNCSLVYLTQAEIDAL